LSKVNVKVNPKVKTALNRQLQKRIKRDRNAAWLINFGGWLVLATLIVLLWHLISVVLPMFSSPKAVLADERILQVAGQEISGDILYQARIQGESIVVARHPDCSLSFYSQPSVEAPFKRLKRMAFSCELDLSMNQSDGFYYLWQLSEQGLLRVFQTTFLDDNVVLQPAYSALLPNLIRGYEGAMRVNMGPRHWTLAFQEAHGWQVFWLDADNLREPRMHYFEGVEQLQVLSDNTGVLIAKGSEIQHIGTDGVVNWQHEFPHGIRYLASSPSAKGFFVQLENLALEKWGVLNDQGNLRYQALYNIPVLPPISQLLFRPESMLGVVNTESHLILFNSSTGKVLQQQLLQALTASSEPARFSWQSERLAWLQNKTLRLFDIERTSAILSVENLFGRIRYEGYADSHYLWQSTTSADEGEAKYSVVPLLMGSVKAALLALLVALPLGLGAAIYTAYFAPAQGRKWLKPTIELLEAIPSVVIGFIAAIWLLPLPEESLAGLLAFFFLIPLFAFVLLGANQLVRRFADRYLRERGAASHSSSSHVNSSHSNSSHFNNAHSKAALFTLPTSLQFIFLYMLLFALLISYFTPLLLQVFTELQLPTLFFEHQRDTHGKNTIVIALALGLAIAPSIYSLAEDAIYEVPSSLRRASYALGATRLQTLLNVVLKVAYPGILSAVMLGFSRALGETMILLMITGNTPMAEWDLVAGMRALTANLAIELPEAEVGSIHYQVLFLTALLLLVFTMAINTIAELLRLRLRKKYQHG